MFLSISLTRAAELDYRVLHELPIIDIVLINICVSTY